MTALVALLPLVWAAMVVAWAAAMRPRGARPLPHRGPVATPSLAMMVGARVRQMLRQPPDARLDRVVGRTIVLGAMGAVVDLRLGAIVGALSAIIPVHQARSMQRRHQAAVVRELPEVIDLLRLSVSAGGSVLTSLEALHGVSLGPVTDALDEACVRVARGDRLAHALDQVVAQTGEPVRPLVRALAGSEHYGTELAPTLERLAGEARDHRRREAHAAARRVPVRLLLPLVLCILPAFVLLTLVAPLASTLDGLGS